MRRRLPLLFFEYIDDRDYAADLRAARVASRRYDDVEKTAEATLEVLESAAKR